MTQNRRWLRSLVPAALAIAAALLTGPIPAMAAGACMIDGFEYPSLGAAVANAPGDTPVTIVLCEDQDVDETICITPMQDITITDDGTPRSIRSTGPAFDVRGSLTIAGTSDEALQIFGSNPVGGASVATVTDSGHLTLSGGTIHGGVINRDSSSAISVTAGTFDMTGGVITDTKCNSVLVGWNAPVTISGNSTMNLSGGSITGNEAASDFSCSGVRLIGDGAGGKPVLNMTGGSITGNKGNDCSAVYVLKDATFNLSGGTVANNTASGKSQCGAVVVDNSGQINMTGGVIEDNTSKFSTVVILSDAKGEFTGGTIRNNTAETAGGAIFAFSQSTQLHLKNAAVYDNTATVMGGGVWFCATGAGTLNATEGLAMFSNRANDAGDDFVSLGFEGLKIDSVNLSTHALGGGLASYYEDGEVARDAGNVFGFVLPGTPRFDATNPSDPVTVNGEQVGSLSLKCLVSDETREAALDKASFVVTGNTAGYGGGIACNGILTTGEPDDLLDRVHSIEISKQDGAGSLVAGASLRLTDDIGNLITEWTSEADKNLEIDLPAGTYVLTETEAPEGYKAADPITFTVGTDGSITVAEKTVDSVVMVDEKVDDETPADEGDEGETPADGEGSNKGDGNETSKGVVAKPAATPRTGDSSSALPLALCMAGAAIALAAACARRLGNN